MWNLKNLVNRTTEILDGITAKQNGAKYLVGGHLMISQYTEEQSINPRMYLFLIKRSGWIVVQSSQARTKIKLNMHC